MYLPLLPGHRVNDARAGLPFPGHQSPDPLLNETHTARETNHGVVVLRRDPVRDVGQLNPEGPGQHLLAKPLGKVVALVLPEKRDPHLDPARLANLLDLVHKPQTGQYGVHVQHWTSHITTENRDALGPFEKFHQAENRVSGVKDGL